MKTDINSLVKSNATTSACNFPSVREASLLEKAKNDDDQHGANHPNRLKGTVGQTIRDCEGLRRDNFSVVTPTSESEMPKTRRTWKVSV